MRKTFLFSVLFFLASLLLPAQQAKRVYVTLDVSGSMTGNKYALANYTTQMIVTLCDVDDEVFMIVYGDDKCLSKEKDPLKVIQKPMDDLKFSLFAGGESQFQDIQGFIKVYKPSQDKQNWLFIIGDGMWATEGYPKDCEKFKKIVKKGDLNVCYLQTCDNLNAHTDFTQFVETLGVVDIGKSDLNPKTIKDGSDHFAKKILGFSEVSLKTKKSSDKCLTIKAELPLTEFVLVYQEETPPEALPNISSVIVDGKELNVVLKGTPTTIPLDPYAIKLSGRVWRVKSTDPIKAGTEIEVCFDKSIKLENVNIYPLVKDIEFCGVGFTPVGQQLQQVNSNTFSICEKENKAKVRVELSKASTGNLPEELLKKTNVVVRANNKEYKANYKDGGFECEIDLIDEETQYYAECDCPGYFHRVTPITTIVKTECDSKPQNYNVVEKPKTELPSVTFQYLKERSIRGVFTDEGDGKTLDPKKFDIEVEVENGFLYEDPKVTFDGDTIVIDIRPKGDWCECLFPENLDFRIVSTPKEGAFEDEDKQYSKTVHPFNIKVEKERSWLSRCFWVLVTIGCLLLFIFYLRALLRKRRFKKSAKIKNTYMELKAGVQRESSLQDGMRLREKGFFPWFKRWLAPFPDERRTQFWQTPEAGSITFVAGRSKETVDVVHSSFDEHKLHMDTYDPNDEDDKKRKLLEMGTIRVYVQRQYKGRLEYDSGSRDDEKYYRIALIVLMLASIASAVVLTVLMIKSFM